MSNILIEANHISKVYDPDVLFQRGKNEYALKGVDFILEEGDFISVMGPSGSGKSTLVNCISTLDRITSGQLKIFGENTLIAKESVLSEFRNKYLGFIFQNHNLILTLSLFDNIAVPLLLNDVDSKKIKEKIVTLAKQLKIDKLLDKSPDQCSGGECQRAAIARALIHQPKIIICDEPTGNLDSRNSHDILKILTKLNQQGSTIVLVTHDPLIASYSKKLLYLYDGNIIETINRNDCSQVDFYHHILEMTSKDIDIEKLLEDNEYVELNPNMFKERTDVYMMLENKTYDKKIQSQYRPLIIYDDCMIYKTIYNEKVKIPFSIVESIHFNIDKKHREMGIFSDDVYYMCFDFINKDMIMKFQSMNQNDVLEIVEKFKSLQINIEGNPKILEGFKTYKDKVERNKYFKREFK